MLTPEIKTAECGETAGNSDRFAAIISALPALNITNLAVAATLIAALYWSVLASNRYVSEAHVIIQLTNLTGGPTMDFSALLGNVASSSRADQMLLRDYLLSIDMLKKLDAELKLRTHFSDSRRDLISRMWLKDPTIEWFHRHFLNRVSVEFDDYAGVLVIKAQGYEKQTAQAIASVMLREGEHFMNNMARNLAQDQVTFLEKQVITQSERAMKARQAVLNYQNRKGLVAPQSTAENIATIVARLEAQQAELQTQLSAMKAYLVANHPNIVQLTQKIDAVDMQISRERSKLTSPTGKTLNSTVEEYQRLEMEAAFALEIYKSALVVLEKGRLEATRNLKKVSVIQAPTAPEYSLEPRRLYNTIVFALSAALLAGLLNLLLAIVRDHKD
jgi:capsular polysaccharide transport system permease protein